MKIISRTQPTNKGKVRRNPDLLNMKNEHITDAGFLEDLRRYGHADPKPEEKVITMKEADLSQPNLTWVPRDGDFVIANSVITADHFRAVNTYSYAKGNICYGGGGGGPALNHHTVTIIDCTGNTEAYANALGKIHRKGRQVLISASDFKLGVLRNPSFLPPREKHPVAPYAGHPDYYRSSRPPLQGNDLW